MNPPAGAAVEFRHVTKRYGPGGPAVDDLSLTVPAGEICVLVGPSGCGKTTSLKMVNRLVEPTSGQVLLGDQDVGMVDPTQLRRHIGYVIQQVGLFPHRTVAENVATVPALLGWGHERIAQRTDELLTLVGLDPARYWRRFPSQLSGGERQRVGVARALAAEPPVMLMDEPFGAVDPIVREHLQDELLRIHRQLGLTVLFVTHDIDEAIKMGDWVAVMQEGGKLAQYARPADLLAQPASEFVARFVGSDRVLKRLALLLVSDLDVTDAPPLGSMEGSPVVTRETSLRDALALLLASEGETLVVESDGRQVGVVTLEALAGHVRSAAAPPLLPQRERGR